MANRDTHPAPTQTKSAQLSLVAMMTAAGLAPDVAKGIAEAAKASAPDDEELMTPAQLAAELHLAPATLADWRVRGIGPNHHKLGGKAVAYRRSDVRAWLAKRSRRSTSDNGQQAA